MSKVTAVILAGGSGSRMQLDTTKQKLQINGVSVLYRTVKTFETCDKIDSIVIVVRADENEFAKSETSDFKKVKKIVVGGSCRAESAKNGFLSIDWETDIVAIHDCARCFITDNMINSVIRDAKVYGAATASYRVTDTVKCVDSDGNVVSTLDRNNIYLVQTPQVFKYELYKKAITTVDVCDASITDDNMLLERIGVQVHCTDTGKENIKLTVREDLKYAALLLKEENNV
jgi:2-C-methyl-D-erythritol 4-phosphate cytidylyltransferase